MKADDALVQWSAVAEPGDEVAGALVDALGPEPAVAWLHTADARPAHAGASLAARHGPDLARAAVRSTVGRRNIMRLVFLRERVV